MVESEGLEKNMTVGAGTNSSYKAISESAVLNNIKPLLKKHGLVLFPVEVNIVEDFKEFQGKYGDTQRFMSTLHCKYKIVDIETGEFELLESVGYGADSQDKGSGKAMTYAYKALIQKTFCLFSGEDTDNDHSEDLEKQNAVKTPQNTPQQTQTNHQQNTPKETKPLSEAQLTRLYTIASKKGRPKDQVIAATLSHFKISDISNLTKQQYDEVVKKYEAMPDAQKE